MADAPTDDDLRRLPTDEDFAQLQWTTVDYYLKETNPVNGLVRDKTEPNAPASSENSNPSSDANGASPRSPWTRTVGGAPAHRWRSLARCSTTRRRKESMRAMAG